jgi:hypothetical protein
MMNSCLDLIILLYFIVQPCIIKMEVEYTEDLIIYEKAEHAVIEGDDLIIKCEFQSKFQVKSTTWLFNGKDLEINSKDDKYTSRLEIFSVFYFHLNNTWSNYNIKQYY